MKNENCKPTIYLEIRGGVLNRVVATEEMNVELLDYDNYMESHDDDNHIDEWERMIKEGLNSKQLTEIPI